MGGEDGVVQWDIAQFVSTIRKFDLVEIFEVGYKRWPVMCCSTLFNVVCMLHLVQSMYCRSSSNSCLFVSMIATGMLGALAFMGLTYKGWIVPWTGHFYSLWDTGHL